MQPVLLKYYLWDAQSTPADQSNTEKVRRGLLRLSDGLQEPFKSPLPGTYMIKRGADVLKPSVPFEFSSAELLWLGPAS